MTLHLKPPSLPLLNLIPLPSRYEPEGTPLPSPISACMPACTIPEGNRPPPTPLSPNPPSSPPPSPNFPSFLMHASNCADLAPQLATCAGTCLKPPAGQHN